MRATLARAGAAPSHVVDTTVWLPDVNDAAAMERAYRETFPATPPARIVVGSRLVAKDARVEIAMTAML